MSDADPHAPTSAGPSPWATGPEPTPVVDPSEASWKQPPGTAAGGSGDAAGQQKPEVLVGGAFAGGFLAALILKRLGR